MQQVRDPYGDQAPMSSMQRQMASRDMYGMGNDRVPEYMWGSEWGVMSRRRDMMDYNSSLGMNRRRGGQL